MQTQEPPEMAFREALAARGFWRDAVLNDPELGFVMIDECGLLLSVNDNAAEILLGTTADRLMGRPLGELMPEPITSERLGFVSYVLSSGRTLLVTSLYRGVRCRCVYRRLPGDAGSAGHVLWTLRRAPIPWQPTDLHHQIDVVDAQAVDWGPLEALSEEERSVLGALASGASPREASERLEQPVDRVLHLQALISHKLKTRSPGRLAQYAVAAGLVDARELVGVEEE
jgi:hypothetical protein